MPPSSKVFNISVTDRAFDFKYYDFYFYILKSYPAKIFLKSFFLEINEVMCWTGVHVVIICDNYYEIFNFF